MKLLQIETTRLTAIFQVTRLSGQAYLPHLVSSVVSRYEFIGSPQTLEDMKADKVDLAHGRFENIAIDRLEVFSDGIVISSNSNSHYLDGFLADLMKWLAEEFGITAVETRVINRMYDSSVVFEASDAILKPLTLLRNIAATLSTELKSVTGLDVDYLPAGLTLSADPLVNPHLKPTPFRLERRVGTEYSLNHFFSSAPLPTDKHLQILKALEAAA